MLVLTRRPGQSVQIGTEVRIVVLSAGGGQVRLGIDAPPEVAVHREEVYERIVAANREAAVFEDVDVDGLWTQEKAGPAGGDES